MDESFRSRFPSQLSCLEPSGRQQAVAYLRMIESRAYTPDTLRAFATTLKFFASGLPGERRALLACDLALAAPRDIDSFIEAERARGLSPVTINLRVSQLREFFHFLIEEGCMRHHPVSRRRRHLAAPQTLPRPVPDSDLVRLFKAPSTRCATA